jgi:hypothetical protein
LGNSPITNSQKISRWRHSEVATKKRESGAEMQTQDKLAELKARARKLDETIVDKDAKEFLLRLVRSFLESPEIASVMLPVIEQQLAKVEDAVSKNGPNLRIVGN